MFNSSSANVCVSGQGRDYEFTSKHVRALIPNIKFHWKFEVYLKTKDKPNCKELYVYLRIINLIHWIELLKKKNPIYWTTFGVFLQQL